jgi:hypothetical protein
MPEHGRFRIMKCRVVCLFVVVAVGMCLATAQDSQVRSSSAKPGRDPLKTATQPLTPKSAMPVHHASPAVVPNTTTSGTHTTAELTGLERQNGKTPSPKNGKTGQAKPTSVPKADDTSTGVGSGINFKYQKPVGGITASTPGATHANSNTPRVNKKN